MCVCINVLIDLLIFHSEAKSAIRREQKDEKVKLISLSQVLGRRGVCGVYGGGY